MWWSQSPSCSSAESFSEDSEADESFEEVVIENESGTTEIVRHRDDGTVDHVSQVGRLPFIGWSDLPYSGKFSLVQIFAEKRPDSSEEIFAVFIFAELETL